MGAGCVGGGCVGSGCVGSGCAWVCVGACCSTGFTVVGGGGGSVVVFVVVVVVVGGGSSGRVITKSKVAPDGVSVTTIGTVVPPGTPVRTSTVDHSPWRS